MPVDIIDSYDVFALLESNWNRLYEQDPDAQYFLSWTWLCSVFRAHPGTWRVLAVRTEAAGDDYVGFFPIRLKTIWSKSRRMFRNELHMAGRLSWAQYTGFVCHPHWEEEVAVELANQLKTMHWSRISLKYFHSTAQKFDFFLNQFTDELFKTSYDELKINKGRTDNLACPYIDLPGDFEDYLDDYLSANTRQKVRRFLRKLESSDELRLTTTNADRIERDLDVLTDLWVRQWIGSKGPRARELADTYRRILQNGFECDALHLPILWRRGAPLGALGCLVDWQKRRLFFLVSSRDESRNEPYVGWMLHGSSIRWAIESGIRIYDFCHGDEAYKYSYGARDRRVMYASISTRSGVNLNGRLDPSSVEEVKAKILYFQKMDRTDEIRTAWQQLRAITG